MQRDAHAFRHVGRDKKNATQSTARKQAKKHWVCSRDEHDHEHHGANEGGRSEIDFQNNQKQQGSDDAERNDEALPDVAGFFFITGKPPGEKKTTAILATSEG